MCLPGYKLSKQHDEFRFYSGTEKNSKQEHDHVSALRYHCVVDLEKSKIGGMEIN